MNLVNCQHLKMKWFNKVVEITEDLNDPRSQGVPLQNGKFKREKDIPSCMLQNSLVSQLKQETADQLSHSGKQQGVMKGRGMNPDSV